MVTPDLQSPDSDMIWFNVVGKCDGCRVCADLAPKNFSRREDNDRYEVVRQPDSQEELKQCQAAYEGCPYRGIVRIKVMSIA